MDDLDLQTSFRDLVFILFKRFWTFISILVLGMMIAFVWLFLIRDDAYLVGAKVLVKFGQEQALPTTALGERPMIVGQRTQDVNSEVDILQSAELIAKVVDHLGLDRPEVKPPPDRLLPWLRYQAKAGIKWLKDSYEGVMISIGLREELTPREKAIFTLQQGLKVISQKDSNVIVATLVYPARHGPSVILNDLLAFYLSSRTKIFQDATAVDFFTAQTASNRAALEASEEALKRFEAESSISTIEKQKEVLLQRIAAAQAPLDTAEVSLREATAKVQRIDRELREAEPDLAAAGGFPAQSFPEEVLQKLAELQREREQLRMQELDDSVVVKNNRAQFGSLVGMLVSHLRATQAEARSEYDTRDRSVKDLKAELAGLQHRTAEWNGLKRQASVSERNYLFYQQKLEEASTAVALEGRHTGNAVVIEPAMDALAPTGLRKTTLLGICLAVTLVVALGWISILEFFDHRVYSAEGLERQLQAPVLAVIPTEDSPRAA
jgi:uncharacterized protein involved in exopolysaccharide biosynthesis